jgi:hypothetical protein
MIYLKFLGICLEILRETSKTINQKNGRLAEIQIFAST